MKLLLIYAHPEPRSLNGSLKDFAITHLETAGHEVKVSDLYNMQWKASLDPDDAPGYDGENPSTRRSNRSVYLPLAANRQTSRRSRPNCYGPKP